MIKYIIFATLLLSVVSCKPKWHQLQNYTFEQYIVDFEKEYQVDSEEYNQRKQIFDKNLVEIIAFNNKGHSYKKGVNRNTDLTTKEFQVQLGLKKSMKNRKNPIFRMLTKNHTAVDLINLPTNVDWRQQGVVSPVKDQGGCGSCWAFASAAVLESAAAIAAGPGQLKTLSTQQLVSCVPNPNQCGGTGGCSGAVAELAFSYTTLYGITSEYKYSYQSYFGTTYSCKYDPKTQSAEVINQGYANVTPNDQNALLQAVATVGPIAISVDASNWASYEEGVFDGCDYSKNVDINHAVVLVGYGTDPKYGDYWLVRNSWGTDYGEDGYIRIKRESVAQCAMDTTPTDGFGCAGDEEPIKVCGMCGILSDSSYPLKVQVIG
ncbi:hypothetical protein ABPG72_021375 [Tetrahymena utriculariae]